MKYHNRKKYNTSIVTLPFVLVAVVVVVVVVVVVLVVVVVVVVVVVITLFHSVGRLSKTENTVEQMCV